MQRVVPLTLAVLALALSGCRIAVTGGLTIADDGVSVAEVELVADRDALAVLDELGVDPTAELAAAAGQSPDWQVTRQAQEDGSLAVRLRRTTPDAEAAADALRELSSGLADADPALLVDLDVDVDGEGAVELAGEVGLRPPATPGASVDGVPVGPDADELARLTADAVRARFTVTVPGQVEDHDADLVDGRTAVWELAGGEPRRIHLAASAPSSWPDLVLVGGAAAAAILLAGSLWWWARRRRAR